MLETWDKKKERTRPVNEADSMQIVDAESDLSTVEPDAALLKVVVVSLQQGQQVSPYMKVHGQVESLGVLGKKR